MNKFRAYISKDVYIESVYIEIYTKYIWKPNMKCLYNETVIFFFRKSWASYILGLAKTVWVLRINLWAILFWEVLLFFNFRELQKVGYFSTTKQKYSQKKRNHYCDVERYPTVTWTCQAWICQDSTCVFKKHFNFKHFNVFYITKRRSSVSKLQWYAKIRSWRKISSFLQL